MAMQILCFGRTIVPSLPPIYKLISLKTFIFVYFWPCWVSVVPVSGCYLLEVVCRRLTAVASLVKHGL